MCYKAFVFQGVGEIESDTDNAAVRGEKGVIAINRRLYLPRPPCKAVIPVDSYCIEVRTDLRKTHGRLGLADDGSAQSAVNSADRAVEAAGRDRGLPRSAC